MTDYIAQLDAASEQDRFTLVRKWMDHEPLSFFKALRQHRPILKTPRATLVTRLDDCIDVLNQPSIFTVALYESKMDRFLMSHDDDAFHTREKSIMQGFLNRNDLPRVRNMIANTASKLLQQSGGNMEYINGFCRMVPATLVQDYFGLDGVAREELIEWSYWNQADTFYNQPFDDLTDGQREHVSSTHKACGDKLAHYITELMARKVLAIKAEQAVGFFFGLWFLLRKIARMLTGKKTKTSTDDITSRMIRSHFASEVEFDLLRVGINAGGLLIGTVETTSQAVAQVVAYLINHPDWLQKASTAARNEDNKTEFDNIVWEALRYVPISSYLFRQASTDAVIGRGTDRETTIPAGGYVLVVTQSAMFDELAFDKPDEFKPGRNWYHQFHFGYGEHQCLGKYVGAEMIPEMVRQTLLYGLPQQDSPIDYAGGHLPQKYQLSWRR